MYEFGFFAQDDWRVNSKLSLNLGIRYDYYSNFSASGGAGAPDAGLYNPSFLSMDGRYDVGPLRDRSKPYNSDPVNFAPRFGFAYNPDGQSKTVIRGGVGILVFDIDANYRFLRRIPTWSAPDGQPPDNVKGIAASAR